MANFLAGVIFKTVSSCHDQSLKLQLVNLPTFDIFWVRSKIGFLYQILHLELIGPLINDNVLSRILDLCTGLRIILAAFCLTIFKLGTFGGTKISSKGCDKININRNSNLCCCTIILRVSINFLSNFEAEIFLRFCLYWGLVNVRKIVAVKKSSDVGQKLYNFNFAHARDQHKNCMTPVDRK